MDFGDVPITGQTTLTANITNTSRVDETVTSVIAPHAPFHATGLPAVGSTIRPVRPWQQSVAFAPTTTGSFTGTVRVATNTGHAAIALSGNGVSGAPHLTITPTQLRYGVVPIGSSLTKTFDIENTGNLLLTITKAAPPAGRVRHDHADLRRPAAGTRAGDPSAGDVHADSSRARRRAST